MSNNKLYGWGANDSGQIGVESEIGVEMFETCNFATAIETGRKDMKVVDFDLGENTTVILLENGEVWWSGMKLVFRPEMLPIDITTKPSAIGACRNGIAVVTGNQVRPKWFRSNSKRSFSGLKIRTLRQVYPQPQWSKCSAKAVKSSALEAPTQTFTLFCKKNDLCLYTPYE